MPARTSLGALSLVLSLGPAARGGWAPDPSPPAQELAGGVHKDARFGYKIRPPKDWLPIPVQIDEGWLIAKYLSDRAYFYTDPVEGYTYEFKPEMMVIAFIHDVVKKKEPDVREEGDTKVVTWVNRYKDYEDYLDQTYSGGGFYVAAKEKVKWHGVDVTQMEIKVEKLTRSGPKRIVTWIFHVPKVDIAVHIEVLEDSYKKLKSTVDRTLSSFQVIERTAPLPTEQASTAGLVVTFVGEWSQQDKTPAERRAARIQHQESIHQRTIDSLPVGWTHAKIGRFLVVTSADEKYAKKLANQAECVWSWLEETFPYVGPGEYVREPILRICKTQDEEMSYTRGGGSSWAGMGLEFITNRETGGALSFEYEWINRRMLDHWFQDRDRDLYWAMPEWLQYGLRALVGNSSAKGSKLRFYADLWNKDDLREIVQRGAARSPRDIVQMTRSEFWGEGGRSVWDSLYQSEAFAYFLMAGDGARNPDYQGFISGYLDKLKGVLEERAAAEKADPSSAGEEAPATEEEEEERYRRRRERLREDEEAFVDEVFRRAFPSWTESDWERIGREYLKSIS
ncbi:MAG: hypothetical protein AB1726_07880 [Planctomycetota bacterium]